MVSTEKIRNVVLVGHNGSGKTSLAEAMLYRAGVVSRPGRIEQGSTVLDSDVEEHERQQSLSLALTSFDWDGYKINLIDTPGYADFMGDALMGLSVADLAVFVVDGVAGVRSQDRALWRRAEEMRTPRLIFINKLDRAHSSFSRTLEQVRAAFGSHADPVELPIGEESSFHGITDVITDRSFVYDSGAAEEAPIPEEQLESEQAEHERLIDEVIESDDDLLERYLEGTEPSAEELDGLLHDAVDAASVFPVLCGSAAAPIGADHLADFICRVGPAPGDAGPALVTAGDAFAEVTPDPDGDPCVFVFKTVIDEFLGPLSLFKVLSGTIRPDDSLLNSRTHATERFHQLAALSGPAHAWIDEVVAGDIAAVPKLGDTATGDTLAPPGMPVVLDPPRTPGATYGVAISAAQKSDDDRLITQVRRLIVEDPTLSLRHDDATAQTVLSGSGETHIQVALSRLARHGVDVETEDVRVPYREILAGAVEVEGKHKKQSGGHGQFGVAQVRFEPLPIGGGFEFDSEVKGGNIPRSLIPAVAAGIEDTMATGGRYGYPLVDLRAVCLDGKHHSVDSSEMAFKMAGTAALRAAIAEVGSRLLEPVSEIRVTVPSDHQGDVLGDLNARRARVLGTEAGDAEDETSIHAHVPTSEITRYAVDLRSMTGGTGSFEVEHHGYQVLADDLVERVTAAS